MRVAFIGLQVHFGVTKSSQFFLDLLRSRWPDVESWPHEETWRRAGVWRSWDLVIYWQHLPPTWEIEALGARRTVLVPMYDASPLLQEPWKPYLGCRIVAFSSTLGSLLRSWGHAVLNVEYATPVPAASADWSSGLRGFFWPRTHELTWRNIRTLLPSGMSIHIHTTTNLHKDHRLVPPSPEEEIEFAVTTSDWFENSGDLERLMASRNVFFAPRRSEGIGMSFLEAMALGMAVVAPDQPTMNEVIRHGVDGWLYDPEHPVMPDWSGARSWGYEAREKMLQRRKQWEGSLGEIIDFLTPDTPAPLRRHRIRRLGAVFWSVSLQRLRNLYAFLKLQLRQHKDF